MDSGQHSVAGHGVSCLHPGGILEVETISLMLSASCFLFGVMYFCQRLNLRIQNRLTSPTDNYLAHFHTAGSVSDAAINLIASPIRNGMNPAASALLKLPSTTANHATPHR